jgi:sporulation protein YlmC with PRC-barrel domain
MTRIAAVLLLLCFQAFAGQSARDILADDAVDDIIFDARSGAILGLEREGGAPPPVWPAMRASQLLGHEVVDRFHRDAGEIVDLDVDLAQKRIEHAVIDLRDDWKPGVRLARVPFTELSLPRDLGEKVAYNFARESLGAVNAGCWVNAFARKQYRPPMTTFTGPTHERISLAEAESLVVGPGARLVGYAGPGFERRTVVLSPEARVPDLDAAGFERRTDAFQVVCEGTRG